MAGRLIENGSANSSTVASPSANRRTIERRVGSDKAAKTTSKRSGAVTDIVAASLDTSSVSYLTHSLHTVKHRHATSADALGKRGPTMRFQDRRRLDNTGWMDESEEFDQSVYERSADVYDVMNAARGKSYPDEAATVLGLVRARVPRARTLLDVACGTGLHLCCFRDDLHVEGVEPHPRLRAIAEARLAGVPVHDGDMRTFRLGRHFDVVTCLFSAIGYMLTPDDLRRAIRQMAAHVAPGGVLVVEPWFHPEAWIDGLVIAESANVDDVAIARLSHSRRDGDIAHFDFYWTVGRGPTLIDPEREDATMPPHETLDAVEQWIEPHRLGLWSDAIYRDAFTQVGLDVEHDPIGLIGRGLYLGYKPVD